ncbi:MAG TPA: alpha/beta fold hydrolase [Burkholderiales bacterium]|nr:alpha/beta fold hydrolase [Burkholderiales bacterium]
MPLFDIGGCKLYYEIDDYTDPWRTPESVLLIHGFTESTPAWRAWVPHLARHYRVIRFDQQGFGQSSAVPNENAFSTAGFVDHAARLIETFGGGSAHVMGAKSGGLVAIELARLRSERVKTLTLASVPLDPPQPRDWMQHMEQYGVESWARKTMPPRLGSRMPPEGFEWWVNLMGATRIETARAYMCWVSNIDVGATLHQVKCPALVLTTQAPRRAYSRADIDVYREKLPQAEIVALPVDGYHVGATDPDECARIAVEFLARNVRG